MKHADTASKALTLTVALMMATLCGAQSNGNAQTVEPKSKIGTDGRVTAIAFSPDGKTLAIAIAKKAQLWDVAMGELKLTLEFDEQKNPDWHKSDVNSIAYSPDGKTIATASHDQTAKIWQPETGKVLATLRGHNGDVKSVAFSPNGKTLATGCMDHTVKLWDPATASLKGTITVPGSASGVETVAFTRDGKILATEDYTGKVRLWDATTGNPTGKVLDIGRRPHCMAFSPDGKAVVMGGSEAVKLWDVATGAVRAMLHHDHLVLAMAFSPNSSIVATASIDRTAKVWEAATGKLQATLKGHENQVFSIAFSPDGSTIATGSEGVVYLWDVPK